MSTRSFRLVALLETVLHGIIALRNWISQTGDFDGSGRDGDAIAASKAQDRQHAAKLWEKVIESHTNPVDAAAFFQLSKAYRELGNLEEARTAAQRGRSAFPSDRNLAVLEAKIAVDQKDWEAARRLWNSVLVGADTAETPIAYLQLSQIECELGRFDRAEEITGKGCSLYPGSSELAEQYAAIAVFRKDWLAAMERWKEAVSRAEDRARPKIYVAAFRSYCRAGNPMSGLSLLEEGLRTYPSNAMLLAEYAISDNFLPRPDAKEPRLNAITLSRPIEIVVCVYNALTELKECLASVFRHTSQAFYLTVVNDGSEESVRKYIDDLCLARPWMRAIHNADNIGYTKSANLGLRPARSEWVLLLNSDTIVSDRWLDGLIECANSDDAIRAVGPLSNSATMQSVPEMLDEENHFFTNTLPNGISVEDFAGILRRISKRRFPRVAILNGFCLLLHRPTVREIGEFDEVRFPRGYGEENDLCLRLVRAGYKLAIADHVYVHHLKTRSFSIEERRRLTREAERNLRSLWADYSYRHIAESIANLEPMVELRAELRAHLATLREPRQHH